MYCLKVVIACPSYKRPYAHVIVEHFKDEELVKSRLNEIKLEYIENHNIDKASVKFVRSELSCQEDKDEDELVTIEDFDNLVESGELLDIVYRDSYMDQAPFEFEIIKITI